MANVPNVYVPQADFVTSSLVGSITNASSSFTIGASLSLDTNGGFLQIDYDSLLPVGTDTGPETVAYTSYNTGTGAVTGVTRAQGGTTAVAHNNTASVQVAPSSMYFLNGNVLGYAQVVADQTAITTQVDLTSLTVSVIVPAGGRRIEITARVGWQAGGTDDIAQLFVIEDGAQIDSHGFVIPVSGFRIDQTGVTSKVPTAGAHTYKLQGARGGGASSLALKGAAGSPSFISVKLV